MAEQFFRGGAGSEGSRGTYAWIPPVDIDETDDALVCQVELRGVPNEDICLETHQNTLPLRGEEARNVFASSSAVQASLAMRHDLRHHDRTLLEPLP